MNLFNSQWDCCINNLYIQSNNIIMKYDWKIDSKVQNKYKNWCLSIKL